MKRLVFPLLVLLLVPSAALAQSVSVDLGEGGAGVTSRLVQLTALVAVLSLAPSLLVMVTSFTRIVIVLSLLRSALGTQGAPPNTVLIGLALFLTFSPTGSAPVTTPQPKSVAWRGLLPAEFSSS